MKPPFTSKSIGVITLIVAIAGTGLPQPAPAQAQNACSIASAQAPERTFDGVNLSPTQSSAFDAFGKSYDALAIRRSFAVMRPAQRQKYEQNQAAFKR